MKDRICVICGGSYTPTSGGQKVCFNFYCYRKNKTKVAYERYLRVGTLSGNPRGVLQRGVLNSRFTNGRGIFQRNIKKVKETRRYCEVCAEDLLTAKQYFWAIHHKDFNRNNNPDDGSNWQLLCKSCHNDVHGIGKKEFRGI